MEDESEVEEEEGGEREWRKRRGVKGEQDFGGRGGR